MKLFRWKVSQRKTIQCIKQFCCGTVLVPDPYERFYEYSTYIPLLIKFSNDFDENLLYISKVIT